jgi:hypothetical protein
VTDVCERCGVGPVAGVKGRATTAEFEFRAKRVIGPRGELQTTLQTNHAAQEGTRYHKLGC